MLIPKPHHGICTKSYFQTVAAIRTEFITNFSSMIKIQAYKQSNNKRKNTFDVFKLP